MNTAQKYENKAEAGKWNDDLFDQAKAEGTCFQDWENETTYVVFEDKSVCGFNSYNEVFEVDELPETAC